MTDHSRLLASGDQIELGSGELHLTVVTVGGGMRRLRFGEWQVLDGYDADEMAPAGAGQPLIPWPNRIEDGAYDFNGHHHQLALSEPARHNAIHGLVRWVNWQVVERSSDRVALRTVIHPQPGYPFTLDVVIEYVVTPTGVTVMTTARNTGDGPLPYASGFHPYISIGDEMTIDAAVLEVPASTRLESDERGIPTATRAVDGTDFDFRTARPVGTISLDTCFTDFQRDREGVARISLSAADASRRATVWMDARHTHAMLFSGDPLPPPRRRRSLAIEPMTAPPNAFRANVQPNVMQPGELHVAAWGIEAIAR